MNKITGIGYPPLLLIDWEVFSGGGVWSVERLIRSQKRVGAEFRAIVDLPIDPLCPKSDQHLISPYNIFPESHINVTRIKEMITN